MCKYKFIINFISIVLVISFIFTPTYILATDDIFVWSSNMDSISTSVSTENNTESDSSNNSLSLESGSAILIEQNSGKVLYEHNIHEQLRPASVTKVMSILLIMEALDSGRISLQDRIPCSETAASMGGSQIWLDVKEELTVDEMLKAICVASANDCDVQKQQEINYILL